MLKCVEQVKRLAESVGATLDEASLRDGGSVIVDAPRGYVWSSSGTAALYASGEPIGTSATRWAEACRDIRESMADGLRKCDAEESERIEYERDEPWTAAADAPETLAVK